MVVDRGGFVYFFGRCIGRNRIIGTFGFFKCGFLSR